MSVGWVPNSNVQEIFTFLEGIAVNTDSNGFKSTALRIGLKDGDDATQGLTADTAVTGDVPGSISAKLRGLSKILAQLQFDGSNLLKVTGISTTVSSAVLSSVAASASSVTLFASNSAAKGRFLTNDSSSSLYLAYASTATTSAYTVLIPANGYWEMPQPVFTGIVSGIWVSAVGNARLTETS